MYFSRLKLDTTQGLRLVGRNEYEVHQALWGLFGDHPDRKRDFIYRKDDTEPAPLFYAVSARPPEDPTGRWRVETKPYRPDLRHGDVLEFSLRVNPVRTIKNDKGRPKRVDVVMDEKCRARARDGEDRLPSQAEMARSAGIKWLESRAPKLGFQFDPDRVRVDGYSIHTFTKNGKPGGKRHRIRFATLEFEGTCTVTDPEAMVTTLYNGVGPAKAFGCGLMLVRRYQCSHD
jgi:CRISPR system Cascade subunit CasE